MKTERHQKALEIIYEYWKKKHNYPTNAEMVELLKLKSANIWGNIRRALIKKNKLVESQAWDFELAEDIFQKFKENDQRALSVSAPSTLPQPQIPPSSDTSNTPKLKPESKRSSTIDNPIDIPILGQVRAGTDLGPDDLIVDLSPSGDTITLPDIKDGQEVYVLEVLGKSMISDLILPNDYVIVEPISLTEIKDGDLVVAKYLNKKFNDILDSDKFDDAIKDPNNFRGPTIKYFRYILVEITDEAGKKVEEIRYQLAPKNKDERYTVITRYLDPETLGRAVSIHRTIRRL